MSIVLVNSFYTENINPEIVESWMSCCKRLGFEVNCVVGKHSDDYDSVYTAHGQFMDDVMEKVSDEDAACFLDIDCLPFDKTGIENVYKWVVENGSFAGHAQNVTHFYHCNHIYAAASFLVVSKKAWNTLDKPSFKWYMDGGNQIDTAQLLTLRADGVGFNYRVMYPVGYDGPEEWRLGGYGMYGRGTLYPYAWHYGRISSLNSPPQIWKIRHSEIMNGIKINPHHLSISY